MHLLFTGGQGVGKSTLIDRMLRLTRRPVYGFRTEKVPAAGGAWDAVVYIHGACANKAYSDANTIGVIKSRGAKANPGVFDTLGVKLLSDIPAGSLVLMDELGFLESEAKLFCAKVMEILDGDYDVIAAVKKRDTPFLSSVLSHHNASVYEISGNY